LSVVVDAVHQGSLKLNSGEKIYCHTPLWYNLTKEYLLHDGRWAYKNLSDRDVIQWIERPEEVVELLKKAGRKIILCSGWMLERGTVTQYIDKVHKNPEARIILTWFQVPGTNWYKILHGEFEQPVYLNNKIVTDNKAYIGNYPLSGHADHEELKAYLNHLHYGKEAKITIVHGGPARHILAQDIKTSKPEITINVPDENGITFEM
jgi:predicted metal-dependent RNase